MKTAEERAREVADLWDDILRHKTSEMADCIAAAIREAEAAEREECAKLVEFRTEHLSSDASYNGGYESLMRGILKSKAEMIRARGNGG